MPVPPRRSSGFAGRRSRARVFGPVALVLLAAAAGCSHGGGNPHATRLYVKSCGTAKTAANVPVQVEIARGQVSCATARSVEAAYADAIRSGKAPGNGGGGPVKVSGWTCQGFATPVVLHTGKASKCTKDGSEILEILLLSPAPAASS